MKVPIKALFKGLLLKASNNSSAILIGTATTGVIFTAYETYKATPKFIKFLEAKNEALSHLEEDREKDGMSDEDYKEFRKNIYISFAKDVVKTLAIPVVSGAVTIGCMLAAHKIDVRKQAELAAALTFKDELLNSYREKVKEKVGEEKEQDIRDSVFTEKVKDGPKPTEKILATNHGSTLCYDAYNDRWFTCSVSYIREKVAEINEELISQCPVPVKLNELYSRLDLPSTKSGERLGWSIGNREVHWSNEFVRLTRDTGIDDDNNLYFVLDFEDELQGI